jgi:hypothetical protein
MTAAAWLSSPVPALLTILFVLALLAHGRYTTFQADEGRGTP